MPLCVSQVTPCHLVSRYPPLQPCLTTATNISDLRKNDFSSLFKSQDDIVNTACVGMLKQLMDLLAKFGGLCDDLQYEVANTIQRTSDLGNKMEKLSEKISLLNPTVDKICLDDTLQNKPYKSGASNYRINLERPQRVADVFGCVEAPPSFHLLNPFKSDKEKDRMKLYSDANFFFESWCCQVKQEVEKKPTKKKTRVKKEKTEVKRKPQKAKYNRIQKRMQNEMLGGGETKGQKSNGSLKENGSIRTDETTKETTSCGTHDDETSLTPSLSSQTTPYSSTASTSMLPPTLPSYDSDDPNLLPPLPPPPISDPTWLPSPPVTNQKTGTLYEVTDFDPNSSILPPMFPSTLPPALNRQSSNSVPQPPPPPPPPTIASFTTTTPNTTTSNIEKKKVVRQDSRSDLLSAIKQGLHLRKVDEKEKIKAKTDDNTGLFDVERIMEMRRRALEDEEEEEDDDDDEYWDD